MQTPSRSRQYRPNGTPTVLASATNTPIAKHASLPLNNTPQSAPPSSYSPSVSTALSQQHKPNVVTRVAIEGKAKHDHDGATVKLYLKIALPLETITPNTPISLFPEGELKILSSVVHPLDHDSAPYHFSSTASPLLHSAARALGLPARLSNSYAELFDTAATAAENGTPVRSSSTKGSRSRSVESVPLDEKFTGKISVSNYNVTFVVPRELPPRLAAFDHLDENDDGSYLAHINPVKSPRRRRYSVAERNLLQFMAAIDIWVPYASKPPRSPYVLNIPTPRCLHNHIRFRIVGAPVISSSFASLSSTEDEASSAWDVMCEPHVTRSNSSRLSRTSSYHNFADDESSDCSPPNGVFDECGVQGNFPSTDTIQIRWAKPTRLMNIPGDIDGRRRVGVLRSVGEMNCAVLGTTQDICQGPGAMTDKEGIILRIEYRGKCSGVWFSGVATQLGMDVGLESKGSDVYWLPGSEPGWTVSGGTGYMGHYSGPPTPSLNQSMSNDIDAHPDSSSSQGHPARPRYDSASSSSSLLRAPLPVSNVGEYSFEGSMTASGVSGTSSAPASSFSSLTDAEASKRVESKPGSPITLHLNLDALNPHSKGPAGSFDFMITGTVIVAPRQTAQRSRLYASTSKPSDTIDGEKETLADIAVVPRFTVLVAEHETTSFNLHNEVIGGSLAVGVYNSSGDLKDAQTLKTILSPGGKTKCGDDGARISLRAIKTSSKTSRIAAVPSSRKVQGQSPVRILSPPQLPPQALSTETKSIPWVSAIAAPVSTGSGTFPDSLAVQVQLPITGSSGTDELLLSLSDKVLAGPTFAASVGGQCLRIEKLDSSTGEKTDCSFDPNLKIHVGDLQGTLLMTYLIDTTSKSDRSLLLDLPSFIHSVGRYEARIRRVPGVDISSSNIQHRQSTSDLFYFVRFMAEEGFAPHIVVNRRRERGRSSKVYAALNLARGMIPFAVLMLLLTILLMLATEIRLLKLSMQSCSSMGRPSWQSNPPPVTVTASTAPSYTPRHNQDLPNAQLSKTWSEIPVAPSETVRDSSPVIDLRNPAAQPDTQYFEPEEIPPIPEISTEGTSLAPLYHHLPWTPQFQLQQITRFTADSVIRGFEVLWYIALKAYHYPLDPP